jgi:hypothetical protein
VQPRIPLGLYATVNTALGAGIPRASVLEAARLSEDEWTLESAARGRELARAIEADPAALEPHDRAILIARGRLTRTVTPLDADLGAWIAFQVAWARAPDPMAFLRANGLTPLDMSRLGATWSQRFTQSESLRMEALEHMTVEGAPVPEVRVGPWSAEAAFAGLWQSGEPAVTPASPATAGTPVPPAAVTDQEASAPELWTALPAKPLVSHPGDGAGPRKGDR